MNRVAPKEVPIGDVVVKATSWNPVRDAANDDITYIDLSAIDNVTKAVSGFQSLAGRDAPSRARQLVRAGDILVSTVRPNLNGVARVPHELDGATASTGFCVLRPRSGKIDPSFLFHWVQSPNFVDDMVRKATGASYPAVSDKIIFQSEIPLPPIEEQKRIAAILDQADELRRKRQRAIDRLNQLGQAIFDEMFGMVENTAKLEDFITKIESGKSLVGNDDARVGGHRVLKISSVGKGGFDPKETKPLPDGYSPPASHLVRDGDLLFSRANTAELVGLACIVDQAPENTALPDKIWRLKIDPKRANKRYVEQLFKQASVRRQLEQVCSGTSGSMKNISQPKLLNITIPSADLASQNLFSDRYEALLALRQQSQKSWSNLQALHLSLQHRAFQGEL